MKKFIYSGIILLVICATAAFAQPARQDSMTVKNSEGKEFWLCFMRNFQEKSKQDSPNDLMLELFITGDKDAKVTIEIPALGYKKELSLPGGTVENVKLDPSAQIVTSEVIEVDHGIHVTSDNPISVYGLSRRFQTTDA